MNPGRYCILCLRCRGDWGGDLDLLSQISLAQQFCKPVAFDEVGSVELLDEDTDHWGSVSGTIPCCWTSSPTLLSMTAGPTRGTNKCFTYEM